MRAWLAQATFGLYSGTGAATLAIERSSMTKEHSVCRTLNHVNEVIVTRQNQDTRSIIFADQLAGDRIVEHQQVDSTVFELVVDL